VCDYFWEEVSKASNPNEVLPVIQTPKYYLIHVQRNSMFFLAVVSTETAPLLVVEFLQRVCDVFTDYFEKLTETSIRDNFVTVYQVLVFTLEVVHYVLQSSVSVARRVLLRKVHDCVPLIFSCLMNLWTMVFLSQLSPMP
jgi:hypothetical protein